jgi:hypothetical protein
MLYRPSEGAIDRIEPFPVLVIVMQQQFGLVAEFVE